MPGAESPVSVSCADVPRTIDLDLLIFKDECIDTDFLKLPHPRLQARRFVLVPLNELVPDLFHPTLAKPVHELLEKTPDNSAVTRWRSQRPPFPSPDLPL